MVAPCGLSHQEDAQQLLQHLIHLPTVHVGNYFSFCETIGELFQKPEGAAEQARDSVCARVPTTEEARDSGGCSGVCSLDCSRVCSVETNMRSKIFRKKKTQRRGYD